jgi:2-C-methyl-D-erythritol 2,4-cyclodiphosphate synthase
MTKPASGTDTTPPDLPFRIGHGYDVHRFSEQPEAAAQITLGGIKIAHSKTLIAHSDGDVLIHALCDAMLGAIAAGDIGRHYPDTDPAFRDIDSSVLLQKTNQMLQQASYQIGNIDITIIAQKPKMSPHIPAMCDKLAQLLRIASNQINIKATTTEGLGFAGREEGIAVHAVVIVYKS